MATLTRVKPSYSHVDLIDLSEGIPEPFPIDAFREREEQQQHQRRPAQQRSDDHAGPSNSSASAQAAVQLDSPHSPPYTSPKVDESPSYEEQGVHVSGGRRITILIDR